jgi:GST-like protein
MPLLSSAAFANAPRTMAWFDRIRARPAVQQALAQAKSGDPRQVWTPGPEINRWGLIDHLCTM